MKKLFYYGFGTEFTKFCPSVYIISEVAFPPFDGDKRTFRELRENTLEVGKNYDLLLGKGIVVRGTVLLSKDAKDAPEELQADAAGAGSLLWKFSYNSGNFWIYENAAVCLLNEWKGY